MAAKPTEPAQAQRGTITKDPEFLALNQIDKALASLPEDARMRVLQYANSRWQPKPYCVVPKQKTYDGGVQEALARDGV